ALVEARNQAESLMHQTEKSLKELGDSVPADEKSKVESALSALKDVVGGEDKTAIETKTNELMQASMKLGELAYRKAQEENAGTPDNAATNGAGATDGKAPDDVVEADFTDLDAEDKK
ncbi:MAG TPA: Hsp70 family protein, partial [Alphaproteobacteria bacterium]